MDRGTPPAALLHKTNFRYVVLQVAGEGSVHTTCPPAHNPLSDFKVGVGGVFKEAEEGNQQCILTLNFIISLDQLQSISIKFPE